MDKRVEVRMGLFPKLHRGMSRFVNSKVFPTYVTMGIVCGTAETVWTLCTIGDNGLPRYAKIADKDPTGILISAPAYGVATLATISTVGVITAIAWPARLGWVIGKSAKRSTELHAEETRRQNKRYA